MDNDNCVILPSCYKYIARNISEPSERYEYSKNFFTNLSKHNVGMDEQIGLYCSVRVPSSCGELLAYGSVPLNAEDYYSQIMESEDIPKVVSCQSYYKKVCKPGKNSVCLTCQYSKNYANNMYADECAVFKYIATSKDNFEVFKKDFSAEIFRSSFDIGSNLPVLKPGIVPLLKLACEQILERGVEEHFTCSQDIRERLNSLVGVMTLSAVRNASVKEIQSNNFKAFPIAWSQVVDDVLSARDISAEEVRTICQKIVNNYGSSSKNSSGSKKKEKKSDTPLLDLLDAEVIEPAVSGQPTGNIEQTSEEYENEETVVAASFDTSSDEQLDCSRGNVDEYSDSDIAYSEDGLSENEWGELFDQRESEVDGSVSAEFDETNTGAVISDIHSDEDYEELPFGPSDVVNPTSNSGDGEVSRDDNSSNTLTSDVSVTVTDEPTPKVPNAGRVVKKYIVPTMPKTTFIYRCEVNRRTLKDYADTYSSNENNVFNAVRQCKVLPIEVVFDADNQAYLFMFVKPLGRYYYCRIDSAMPKTLEAVFKSKSIRKICYQPYFLYSLCRLHGFVLCEVYSIYSMDQYLHPNAMPCVYQDFWELYKHDFNYTPLRESGFEEFDTLCCFMQIYIQLQAKQIRNLSDNKLIRFQQCKDEVLGVSFLRALNLKENGFLFDIDSAGTILYNTNYDLAAHTDGFFVTYTIGMDDAPDIEREELYMSGLIELSNRGRISKYNIQLVTMSDVSMVLFIGVREYELVITLLQKFYNRYAFKRRLENFSLNVSHERIYAKEKRIPRIAMPRSYEEVKDRLVTTNASVEVAKEHITVRRKKDTNKRKKQTEKFIPGKK
ncbi:hypothetical protein [Butyrivibrio hungatei]|uniref:Uncharacterized protein n=1 Tax=Butyrivibrio hungatei TaxID=185008 RepID=A0A1D9P6D3_9FIRM|nr:hypothetical protein [Butyrivibrio hungatei]AOZ97874.1 hypothetical protein bhn_II075 [Butyrivibrio hungatei]